MARGRFAHNMDSKGRLAIPQALRMELQAHDKPPILTSCIDAPAVGIYAQDRWVEIEQRLASMSQVQPEIQKIRRLIVSGAEECPIDSQGRIRVPQHLRDYAGLSKQCLIAGMGERIEIWDRARFDQEIASIRENGEDVSRVAADLGL